MQQHTKRCRPCLRHRLLTLYARPCPGRFLARHAPSPTPSPTDPVPAGPRTRHLARKLGIPDGQNTLGPHTPPPSLSSACVILSPQSGPLARGTATWRPDTEGWHMQAGDPSETRQGDTDAKQTQTRQADTRGRVDSRQLTARWLQARACTARAYLNAAARGGVVARDGHLQRRVVGQGHDLLDQPLAKGAFAHDDAPIQILQPCVPRVAERVMRPPPVSAVIQGNGVVSATLYIGCV